MAVEQFIASTRSYPWTLAFSTSTAATGASAGLASGSAVLSTISVANGSSLVVGDIFADVAMISTFSMAIAAPLYLGIYLYPLNSDGVTYGDGYITSTGSQAIAPSAQYFVGAINVPSTVGSTVKSVLGNVSRIVLPQGTYSWAIYNQLGVALSTVFQVYYRAYNRQVV